MDETIKNIKGPCPFGGEYAKVFFFNDKLDRCKEEDATTAVYIEYDKWGNGIFTKLLSSRTANPYQKLHEILQRDWGCD